MADARKIHVMYICNFVSSKCWQILFCVCENLQFVALLHHLSEIFIDDNMMCISLFSSGSPVVVRCMGFGWVRVGLGHGSTSSPGSGLGWVGSECLWVGLGRGL